MTACTQCVMSKGEILAGTLWGWGNVPSDMSNCGMSKEEEEGMIN